MGMAARSSSPWVPRTPAVTAVVLMSKPRKRAFFAKGYLLAGISSLDFQILSSISPTALLAVGE
jgi:hypothetical protein